MLKFRNNLFYLSAIVGFLAWIVNSVAIIGICGITHPIMLRELFYLAILLYTFYFYAQKHWEDIDVIPLKGRAEVSPGDVLVFRFLGPWMTLIFQLAITVVLLNSVHRKLFLGEDARTACELRSRYR